MILFFASDFVSIYCSDFPYENNGIFVLGVFFFLQTNFDFLISHFSQNFYIIQKV